MTPPGPVLRRRPRGPRTLGLIALIAAGVALTAGAVLMYIAGHQLGGIGQYVDVNALLRSGESIDPSTLPPAAARTVDRANTLALAGFATWSLLAVWGIVQGIVAIVRRRGRAWGVTALVLAVLGYVLVQLAYSVGISAGVGPYLHR